MTVRDYIERHELKLWKTWPVNTGSTNRQWLKVFFTSPDFGNVSGDDKFEIYANPDHTHFVSLNVTREQFRIIHYDMIAFWSKWESMRPELNYPVLEKL